MSEAFDSEAAKTMARALSLAMDKLGAGMTSGGADEARAVLARAVLARAIIDAADKGERDAEKLAAYAIEEYKKTRGDGSSNGKSVN
jgi:hypothetical protein